MVLCFMRRFVQEKLPGWVAVRHFFLVLCSVYTMNQHESTLVSLPNQGGDCVILCECRLGFEQLYCRGIFKMENMCSLHIWVTNAVVIRSGTLQQHVFYGHFSNRFHCGQANSSSSESTCAVFECNVAVVCCSDSVVVLWFCHIQMWLVCLVPFSELIEHH